MTVLIIGTPDSGKSEKAEDLAMELASGSQQMNGVTLQKKYYIATMIPYGEEGAKRVEKHRKLREGKGFITIEKPTAVNELIDEISDLGDSTCLLECMSNLIGNEMHGTTDNSSCSMNDLRDRIVNSVMDLAGVAANMVIVTNSFPLEDASFDEDTRQYVRLVNLVNEQLRKKVDRVYKLCEGEWTLSENN